MKRTLQRRHIVWAGQMLAKHGELEEAVAVYYASEGLEAGDWEAY